MTDLIDMTDASPELQQQVGLRFGPQHPEREFLKCKVAEVDGVLMVRVYSRSRQSPNVMPVPYQVFRFDPVSGTLSPLTGEEAAPFRIPFYK